MAQEVLVSREAPEHLVGLVQQEERDPLGPRDRLEPRAETEELVPQAHLVRMDALVQQARKPGIVVCPCT